MHKRGLIHLFSTLLDHFQKCVFGELILWHLLRCRPIQLLEHMISSAPVALLPKSLSVLGLAYVMVLSRVMVLACIMLFGKGS